MTFRLKESILTILTVGDQVSNVVVVRALRWCSS